jgi:nucleotide-binding universal stress UspA family protein
MMKNPSSYLFRRILVPIDFTEVGQDAARYAIDLASSCEARVVLFHAYHLPVLAGDQYVVVTSMKDLEQESISMMDRLCDELVAETGYQNISCIVNAGLAVDKIADAVKEENIDLVVMGTSGAGSWGSRLMGTNTSELSSRCGCPVLVIPDGLQFQVPQRVLFLTDYSDNDFQSIFLLAGYFRQYRPQIVVAHVESSSDHDWEEHRMEKFRRQVRDAIAYDKIVFELLSKGDVEDMVEEFLERIPCDIVAVATSRRNLFDRLTGHSLTRKMVLHPSTPLLVFHAIRSSATPLF